LGEIAIEKRILNNKVKVSRKDQSIRKVKNLQNFYRLIQFCCVIIKLKWQSRHQRVKCQMDGKLPLDEKP